MNEAIFAGKIRIRDILIDVYNSFDDPLFRASDIAKLIDYSYGNVNRLVSLTEEDERLELLIVVSGQRRKALFVTEKGLYDILEQSRMPLARAWRSVVNEELIKLRKSKNMNIEEQFDDWNLMMEDIFFDEETGDIYRSVTVVGGDVEQVKEV